MKQRKYTTRQNANRSLTDLLVNQMYTSDTNHNYHEIFTGKPIHISNILC